LRRTYDLPFHGPYHQRWAAFYEDWEEWLGTVDYSTLSADSRIDFHLFRNHLHHEKQARHVLFEEETALIPHLPHAGRIIRLELKRRAGERPDWSEAADTLESIEKSLGKTGEKLESGKIPAPTLRAISRLNKQLVRILKDWYTFYDGYDPQFTWWIQKPYEKISKAMEDHLKKIEEKLGSEDEDGQRPIIGQPIGRDGLIRELRKSMISNTPEELLEIGHREYAWCEKEMIKASRELGYGKKWLDALEYVKSLHVPPGDQPALIRELALEAVMFVEAKDLITVPDLAEETWKMRMMSPERQLVNPFFTGGEWISVSFPTQSMTHPQKVMSLRGNNEHFCRATVHHELIPGHHLQAFMTRRHKAYRRIFRTPFWLEGWPLHWEMLLWDLGFARGPEDRVGMLFWRMHRASRIIFSLSYHMEKMTPEECVEFLVEKGGHEPANAEAEVRRSFEEAYPPLYQCAYLLGGIQMRSLYHSCIESGQYTPRSFHDAVMHENSMPLVLLRAKLMDLPLGKSDRPAWDFSE
jgi:uncharacterized protein (DUF885 family)